VISIANRLGQKELGTLGPILQLCLQKVERPKSRAERFDWIPAESIANLLEAIRDGPDGLLWLPPCCSRLPMKTPRATFAVVGLLVLIGVLATAVFMLSPKEAVADHDPITADEVRNPPSPSTWIGGIGGPEHRDVFFAPGVRRR